MLEPVCPWLVGGAVAVRATGKKRESSATDNEVGLDNMGRTAPGDQPYALETHL